MTILLEQAYTDRAETKELTDKVVEIAYDSVVSTMGPNGNLVMIIEANQPVVTKDGVRVARALDFNDIRMNSIASLITSAARKTDDMVGDGTTTTVMMTRNLYRTFGSELNFFSTRLIDGLVKETKEYLETLVRDVTPDSDEFVRMVYTTSNYQSDIADTVISLFKEYSNPNVLLKRARGEVKDVIEASRKVKFGGRFPHGSLKPNTSRNAGEIQNAFCYAINGYVREIDPSICEAIIMGVMKQYKDGKKDYHHQNPDFIVLGREFDANVLDGFVQINQWLSQELKFNKVWVVPYNVSGGGTSGTEIMNDLCRVLGIPSYSDFKQLDKSGEAKFDVIKASGTFDISSIEIDPSVEVEGRDVKQAIDDILLPALDVYNGMNYTEKASPIGQILFNRISTLRAENITIYVSGLTDAEISERYYLYEDAVKVAASSLRFGVLPGIGWGYTKAANNLLRKYHELSLSDVKKDQVTWDIVRKFMKVLTAQYEHLTGEPWDFEDVNYFVDLVTGEQTLEPKNVFDNGSASIVALEGGWSVVKRLGNLSCIMGKSNTSYSL